ncbi:TPA: HD domain-containing protein [Candidatus Woesearchaeota archaeon]|nr:HD domain-containing protein [Candidatus Woesearchaeota archaeon]HIH54850.1 HD domain-containing protein [Candidatus Woesearchaeota archaeon]HIJ01737.1 HD domain-containing protein [Candidatus Woesearchaeota archaeon]HIJ14443.1 HD domain-containing protein [Candidatus Woesearchaeota archaeon]
MEYSNEFIESITQEIIRIISLKMEKHPYHNFEHALDVYRAIQIYTKKTGLNDKEKFLLSIAALFHDIIYIDGAKDNEENSALKAESFMEEKGFSKQDITIVKSLIRATKFPTNPKTVMEMLICDADLDHLGTDECKKISLKLKKEWGVSDEKKWWTMEKEFMKKHHYYSSVAKKLRNHKKAQNLEEIKAILKTL